MRLSVTMTASLGSILCASLMLACTPSFKSLQSLSKLPSEGGLDIDGAKAACTDPDDVAASDNRRMTKIQLVNTLTDLFGAPTVVLVQSKLGLVPDDSGTREWRFNPEVTAAHAQSYIDLAFDVAASVYANTTLRNRVFGSCASLATVPANCIDGYLAGFATKLFRRPLTASEKIAAKIFYAKAPTAPEAIVNLLTLHLASPQFLIRWELGTEDVATSKFTVTNHELAARLAFDLTDSTPDDAILALADSGALSDPATLQSEARRLAETPRGKYKIRQMFYGWLQLKESFDLSSLGTDFIGTVATAGLAKASLDEIDEYLNYIIFDQKGTFQDLLTSQVSFARHAGLASIYGHAPVTGSPALLPPGRQGLFSRLSYLYANTSRSNIIMRGVTFRRNVLCQTLPSPSLDVINSRNATDLTEAQIAAMTNKEYTAHRTQDTQCMFCHASINPTGLAFETFDSLGRLRTEEKIYDNKMTLVNTLPIDSTASIPWGSNTLNVTDSGDLAERIANSPVGQACFAKNIYEFVNARDIASRDGCHLNETAEPLQFSGSILDAFINAAVNRGTQWKRIQ